MKLRLVAVAVLFFGITLAEVDCGDADVDTTKTLTLTNTDDINSLATACPTVLASISISTDAGEDINLDGIETISGSLGFEYCETALCLQQAVTRISSSTLQLVVGDLIISGLDRIANVSFPLLGDVKGNIAIQDLTDLDTLDLSAVSGVGGNFSLSEVEQLYYLDLSFTQAQDVSISGNGALVVQFGKDLDAINGQTTNQIQRLDISGVGELRWGESINNITLADISIHDSKIAELPLLFSSIQSLEILNNNKLTDILFPAEDVVRTALVSRLQQITIRDNEMLNMTTIHTSTWNGTDMLSWVWPTEDMSSVELEGIIHNTFFEPLIDAHLTTTLENANSSKSRVLQNFNVTSTASTFHCDPIDELRRHGVFPGIYTCNGDNIPISNSPGIRDSRRLLGTSILAVAAGLLTML